MSTEDSEVSVIMACGHPSYAYITNYFLSLCLHKDSWYIPNIQGSPRASEDQITEYK